jgi:hypothetical protein
LEQALRPRHKVGRRSDPPRRAKQVGADIIASRRVEIRPTAKVFGNITTPVLARISIDPNPELSRRISPTNLSFPLLSSV